MKIMDIGKRSIILMLVITGGLITGCASDDPQSPDKPEVVDHSPTESGTDSYDMSGTFGGTLPCADCAGIKTRLRFTSENQVQKTRRYLGTDDEATTVEGSYKLDQEHDLITANFPDESKTFYRIKTASVIVQLNADKERITGPLADNYVLTRKGTAEAEDSASRGH